VPKLADGISSTKGKHSGIRLHSRSKPSNAFADGMGNITVRALCDSSKKVVSLVPVVQRLVHDKRVAGFNFEKGTGCGRRKKEAGHAKCIGHAIFSRGKDTLSNARRRQFYALLRSTRSVHPSFRHIVRSSMSHGNGMAAT
jgi:hypothetical protein